MKNGMQRLFDGLLALVLLLAATVMLYRVSFTVGLVFTAFTVLYALFLIASGSNLHLHLFRYFTANISSVLPNILKTVDAPVLVVGDTNRIIWANKQFENLPEMSSYVLLPSAEKIFSGMFSYARLEEAYTEEKDTFELETDTGYFRVRIIELTTKSKKYYATFWANASRELDLKHELMNRNAMLAFISVDNASELSQNANETFRLISAKINIALTEWAKSIDGVLLEYEDGKFMLLFEKCHLTEMEEDKFTIVDTISELSSGNSALPLTISIGVSEENGTLADKQASAMNALRIALQKGGACAVIKTPDGYRSYGGKTKSIQKQTSIRSRICRDLLIDNIRTSSNVLIMGHRRPDFDSIASNIGVAKLASYLGKQVHIVTDRDEVNIKPAFEILKPLTEYDEMFVDARGGQDLMTPYTLLVITDASNPDNFFSQDLYNSAQRVIVIDHHTLDKHLGENVLSPTNIDPNASSASELVCEILELAIPDGLLRAEEAQLMMLGILLDTQFFERDTGSRTFRACSYLRSAGADLTKAKKLFKTDLTEFELINHFESSRYLYEEHFMICFYDGEPETQNMVAAAKSAERLAGISGVHAAFALYTTETGISLSARSDGSFNVLNIVSKLGGGGHFQSAGARFANNGVPVRSMEEAQQMLQEAIDQFLSQ